MYNDALWYLCKWSVWQWATMDLFCSGGRGCNGSVTLCNFPCNLSRNGSICYVAVTWKVVLHYRQRFVQLVSQVSCCKISLEHRQVVDGGVTLYGDWTWFYFLQRLQQLVSQWFWSLQGICYTIQRFVQQCVLWPLDRHCTQTTMMV